MFLCYFVKYDNCLEICRIIFLCNCIFWITCKVHVLTKKISLFIVLSNSVIPYHKVYYISGKGRTKKESEQHTNQHDPGGHTRKTTQKLINSHQKEKEQNLKKSDAPKSWKKPWRHNCYIFLGDMRFLCTGVFGLSVCFNECVKHWILTNLTLLI